jgi:sec-independent protein translocase protein TatC
MDNNQGEEIEGQRLTIIEHLEELRRRLVYVALALVVATAFSFIFTGQLLEWLKVPAGNITLIYLKPTEMFITYFKVALLAGVAFSMPMIMYQVIRFIVPGLKPSEKKYLYFILPGASLLFLLGVSFAYWVLLPFALKYLLNFGGDIATAFISIEQYVSFVTTLLMWLGVVFELPMVIVFLAKVGVVNQKQLRGYWKYALVGSFVIAAVITPTPDPFNQTLVAVPLYLLYEVGVLFSRLV